MTTGELRAGAARLAYELAGGDDRATPETPAATPFVFQHGMGGNLAQPLGYVGTQPQGGVVCLAARGHAPSSDLTAGSASFDVFADDVIALADRLGLEAFPVGGISLGAGTAVNLAVRYPERVSALVLCRPAWLDGPLPEYNRSAYAEIADLLDELVRTSGEDIRGPGPEAVQQAAAAYQEKSTIYRQVAARTPAAASSLVGQITRPRAAQNSLLIRALPADQPTLSAESWSQIDVPTLVLGHRDDPFHPYPVAQVYVESIPGSQLVTVPSKDADATGFAVQIRAALDAFLRTR